MLVLVIEGLVIMGEREQAATFYPMVHGLIDTGTVCFAIASRFLQTVAGIAAAAACNWEAAEGHFHIAARQAQDFPHLVELAEVRRFHGAALLARGDRQDRDRAQTSLRLARDGYVHAGMPRHIEMTDALLKCR